MTLARACAGWGLRLDPRQHARLEEFASQVLSNNERCGLTAAKTTEDILLRHAADGLAAVPLLAGRLPKARARVADLGAGAGFVGIPIAIALPESRVTLIEPLQRRFNFLNAVTARLGLAGVRVLRKSAAELSAETFDAVLARALAPLPKALALAMPLVAAGGCLAVYQSAAPDPAEAGLAAVLRKTGARLSLAHPYRLPGEGRERFLALFAGR